MLTSFLNRLRTGNHADLAGTDLLVRLPVRQRLINAALAAQSPAPVRELRIDCGADNLATLHLEVDAPIVGRTRRELSLRINGDVRPGQQDIIDIDILAGLQFLDKPLINLARGIIAEKLPAGVELTSKRLRIHFSQLLTALDYGYVLPLLDAVRIESHAGQLQLLLHLKAE
jgi:hypothetical protein